MDIRTTRFGPHNMLDIVHEREQRITDLEAERDDWLESSRVATAMCLATEKREAALKIKCDAIGRQMEECYRMNEKLQAERDELAAKFDIAEAEIHELEADLSMEANLDAMRAVVDAAKAWREDWHDGTGAPDDKALAAAVDKLEGKCDGF